MYTSVYVARQSQLQLEAVWSFYTDGGKFAGTVDCAGLFVLVGCWLVDCLCASKNEEDGETQSDPTIQIRSNWFCTYLLVFGIC